MASVLSGARRLAQFSHTGLSSSMSECFEMEEGNKIKNAQKNFKKPDISPCEERSLRGLAIFGGGKQDAAALNQKSCP